MPHMTGGQLIAKVHAMHPELPIILATGYSDLQPGIAAEITRLAKPFTQTELASALATALVGTLTPERLRESGNSKGMLIAANGSETVPAARQSHRKAICDRKRRGLHPFRTQFSGF